MVIRLEGKLLYQGISYGTAVFAFRWQITGKIFSFREGIQYNW